MAWNRPALVRRQSERMAAYGDAAARLKELGRLYPAYETAEELDRRRKRQQALGRPPIYDRAALRLTADERAALEASGRKPHWRFRLDPTTVRWDDIVRGDSHIDCASLSDPVLRREDGTYLYTLPSVVDDIDFGVTHVIRGEDHVTNTAVQIQIFEALAGAGAEFRPPQPPDQCRRRGSCRSAPARCQSPRCGQKELSCSLSPRSRCSLVQPRPCVPSPRLMNWRISSIFRNSPMARPILTKPSWRRFPRARCIGRRMRRWPTGWPRSASPDQRRAPVAGGSGQPFAPRRCGDLVASGRRRHRADHRGRRLSGARCLMRARERLGPVNLGRVDDPAQGTQRPQRAGAVSPVAAGLDWPGGWAGTRRSSAADWPC